MSLQAEFHAARGDCDIQNGNRDERECVCVVENRLVACGFVAGGYFCFSFRFFFEVRRR